MGGLHINEILTMKANEMHYFSDLFDKVLYIFWTSQDDHTSGHQQN